MPSVANILSIEPRSNPPQKQRSDGEDSFSSMLQTNADDDQNELPQTSQPESAKADSPERPSDARTYGRRAPEGYPLEDAAQANAPKCDEADGALVKDSAASADDTSADTSDQQTSPDILGEQTLIVAAPVVSIIDPGVQISPDITLGLSIAIAAPDMQLGVNASETTPSQAATPGAALDVAPPATAEATAATATVSGSLPLIPMLAGLSADIPDLANDPTIQIAVAAVLKNDGIKIAAAESTGAVPMQSETVETDSTDTRPNISSAPEIIAAIDPENFGDAPKAGISANIVARFATGLVSQSGVPAHQAGTVTVGELMSDAKQATNAAQHTAVKPNAESGTETVAPRLILDLTLAHHLSSNAADAGTAQTAVLPDPLRVLTSTLNPASAQIQAQTAGTASQPIPLANAALAVEIAARLKDGVRQFEIRLDPPELGRIDVRLDVDKSGEVSTRLTIDRQDTLDLLQRDARGLERALQSAGLKTSDGDLSFSLRQQTADGSANDRAQTQTGARSDNLAADDNEQTTVSIEQYQWAARLRGGVDIRV